MLQIRYKNLSLLSTPIVFVLYIIFLRGSIPQASARILGDVHNENPAPKKPTYKEDPSVLYPPVVENFPLAQAAHSASDLPPIPSWNALPSPHVSENTPLFIGFTRNWRVLQQVVVSYITAGWPAEDIYIVENTGVMDSNAKGLLSLQNTFYLNHTRLEMFGNWDYYFWSHMDVIVASFEDREAQKNDQTNPNIDEHKFRTLYQNCLHTLRETLALPQDKKWAMRFFSYDRLALVNIKTFKDVGGWDTMIPFYTTDCDMHFRLSDSGYSIEEYPAGMVYDVAASLDDLSVLYRKKIGEGPQGFKIPGPSFKDPNIIDAEIAEIIETEKKVGDVDILPIAQPRVSLLLPLNSSEEVLWEEDNPYPSPSPLFLDLLHTFDGIAGSKHASKKGRNTWQARTKGGKGEPFYRDSAGFEQAIQMTIEHGRRVFAQKWGHRDCDLVDMGLHVGDEWRVVQDWKD